MYTVRVLARSSSITGNSVRIVVPLRNSSVLLKRNDKIALFINRSRLPKLLLFTLVNFNFLSVPYL